MREIGGAMNDREWRLAKYPTPVTVVYQRRGGHQQHVHDVEEVVCDLDSGFVLFQHHNGIVSGIVKHMVRMGSVEGMRVVPR